MQKIMNFRAIALFGLSLVLGGYFFAYFFESFISRCLLVALLVVLIGLFFINKLYKNSCIVKRLVCFVLLPFVLGIGVVSLKSYAVISSSPNSGSYIMQGRVEKITQKENGGYYVYVNSATMANETTSFDVNGIIRLSVSKSALEEDVFVGDKISATGNYVSYYNSGDTTNFYNAKNNYAGKFSARSVTIKSQGGGVKYTILKSANDAIEQNMTENVAPVAFAMLFGDKSGIDPELNYSFSASGMSHILAVSGLHVGFIITLFGFLLGLFIKNKNIKSAVMVVLVVFYAYLCSFSASVVRAAVMSIIMMGSYCLGKQYDGINALGLSACVNFALNPLCIFNLSFLLSYTVVFAIFALSPLLSSLFSKRLPKNVATSLAVSVSAWIGGMALVMLKMKSFSFYAVVLNILIIPFVTIVFMCLCIATILAICVPILGFLFAVPNFLFGILVWVIEAAASLKFSALAITTTGFGLVCMIFAILLSSDYVFHKRKYLYSSMFVLSFFVLTILIM